MRDFYDRLKYLRNLEDRKQQVKASIEEQNRLTPEIISALQEAKTLVEVEDVYEPYKKKRKTRASVAIEKGLEPLSYMIRLGEENLLQQAQNFVNEEKEVLTAEDALQGAMDIVAQQLSEDFERKKKIRNIVFSATKIETSQKKGAEEKDGYLTYSMYFEYNETAKDIPPHRILAINRGEKEDILKVKYLHEEQNIKSVLMEDIAHTEHNEDCLNRIVEDALKRLILPSLERELRSTMTT